MNHVETPFVHRPACELCGSQQAVSLLAIPFVAPPVWDFLEGYYEKRVPKTLLDGATYEICRCKTCGFLWQASILNDRWMGELYERWISAEASLKKKQAGYHPALFRRQMETVAALFPHQQPGGLRLLDFGTGWGFWCMAAQEWGYNVRGLEISPTRVAFARERGVQVAQELSELSGQQFSFINAEQVFEHIPRPADTLRALAGYLAPGGVVRIAVPDARHLKQATEQTTWEAVRDVLHPLEHINAFSHQTLNRLGQEAGLDRKAFPLAPVRKGWRVFARSIGVRSYRAVFGTTMLFQKAR